jgi:hypothetical protein
MNDSRDNELRKIQTMMKISGLDQEQVLTVMLYSFFLFSKSHDGKFEMFEDVETLSTRVHELINEKMLNGFE